jgi:predicted DNA-binding transcriptional regulator YafY
MPANKYALIRYRVIDRCLRDKYSPFPGREDLRDACEAALFGSGGTGISLSTIDKDIWAMKNEQELGYHAPIEYDREKKGYCYTDPEYSISQLSLGDEDLEALRFAAAILNQFREMPILNHYQNAVEKITNRLTVTSFPQDEQLDRFIQFEKSTISGGNEYLGPLLGAIQQRRIAVMDYQGFRDERIKHYTIYPLLLKEYANRWYLVAHVPERKDRLTFGLERIRQLSVQEHAFDRPTDFDPERFFMHSIGITESKGDPVEVILKCEPVAGKLLKTQPLHFSQKVIEEGKEGSMLSLQVVPTQELISRILSFGSEIIVVEPTSLAKTIRKILRTALKGYK